MKYDKIRGSSIAEMMMQLRSQYGQSVYIIQTREVKQGGLFGSDLLAKKQYEIEYMVSEGDAPYGKAKPQRPAGRTVLERSLPTLSERRGEGVSGVQAGAVRPSTVVAAARSEPEATKSREARRDILSSSASGTGSTSGSTMETNLNDLDALIDSLKALKTRTVEATSTREPHREPVKETPASPADTVPPSLTSPVRPARAPLNDVMEAPTREELEALFRVDAEEEPEPIAVRPTGGERHQDRNPLARIRDRLIENQGSVAFVDRFLQRLERSLSEEDRLHPNRVRSRSIEKMKDMIRVTPVIEREHGERKIVFFVGPNGSGKTTSLAKLAYRYQLEEAPAISLYSLDLHRVAATEQLKTYAAVLQVPFFSPLFESDFREYLDRDGSQLIFVDTSGMGLRNADRRDELVRFIECVKDSVEVHLVLPVSISPSLTEKYLEFFEPTGFEKILLTRLDEADFLANFIEVADKWKRPFSFLNNSPEVSSPLMNAGPEDLARMVLGLNS
ncbi:MAG: hypothetical protein F9K24_19945 [Leptonema illini]|uniref:SRP54-type proteins GTP-binding domain-containing protein n=1 Tax=Leptonema illini TaxID=183 RepID=A0A833GY15_9LEPT|nr:MAG: hypothetical protein F9K24_19945 [Leptonema illini]